MIDIISLLNLIAHTFFMSKARYGKKLLRLWLIIGHLGCINGGIAIGHGVLSENIGVYAIIQLVPDSWKAQVD